MLRQSSRLLPRSSSSGLLSSRLFSSSKIPAPPMVYIAGEEMSRWAGELYLNEWIRPYVDISKWEFYDLSCVSRDKTQDQVCALLARMSYPAGQTRGDQVLRDCIAAGRRIGAIYKEPTITPTEDQAKEFGLSKAWGSPNGAMRKGTGIRHTVVRGSLAAGHHL